MNMVARNTLDTRSVCLSVGLSLSFGSLALLDALAHIGKIVIKDK